MSELSNYKDKKNKKSIYLNTFLFIEITFFVVVLFVGVNNSKYIISEIKVENQEVRIYQGEGTYSGKNVMTFEDKSGNNKEFIVGESYLSNGKISFEDIIYIHNNGKYFTCFLDENVANEFLRSKRQLFILSTAICATIVFLIIITIFYKKRQVNS